MTSEPSIPGDPFSDAFFSKLWESNTYQKVFFSHRRTLFPSIDAGKIFYAPLAVLFAGTTPDPESTHVLNVATEVREHSRENLARSLANRISEFGDDMKTAACLLILRFVTKNPQLRALLESDAVAWPGVAKSLADSALDLKIFDEFATESGDSTAPDETPEPAAAGTVVLPKDSVLMGKIGRYADELRRFFSSGDALNATQFIDQASLFDVFYTLCREHYIALLDARRLSRDEYLKVLKDLYLKKLIANKNSVFWCPYCHDDLCVLRTSSRLSPHQACLPCPKCQKEMMWATLYDVHPIIRESCLSKDGCLGEAARWLFQKHSIPYEQGTYTSSDFELDFQFSLGDRRILLECKMYKTNKDAETIESNISKAVAQAAKHAKAAMAAAQADSTAGTDNPATLTDVWVLTNLDRSRHSAEIQRVEISRRAEFRRHNIEILDPPTFARYLTEEAR